MKEARAHLKFSITICKHQAEAGRYFAHEHPKATASWNEPDMKRMVRKEGNAVAEIDQCQYGLWIDDIFGWVLAKEPTRFFTDPIGMAQELQKMCPGAWCHEEPRHAALF